MGTRKLHVCRTGPWPRSTSAAGYQHDRAECRMGTRHAVHSYSQRIFPWILLGAPLPEDSLTPAFPPSGTTPVRFVELLTGLSIKGLCLSPLHVTHVGPSGSCISSGCRDWYIGSLHGQFPVIWLHSSSRYCNPGLKIIHLRSTKGDRNPGKSPISKAEAQRAKHLFLRNGPNRRKTTQSLFLKVFP
ncbi:biogenesis of lysosome-related organelles complex 1 subunit 6 isoform X1 [Eumetopias jubatus]|uniref:biogenesis of lysosome-related organelles complex 1 subunit 6 isoform X1 n=1 Tax=Eumetopias jubatus TaxID=34886 RepID=UPI0010167064|nr:biogenesis of lysosome-related organelles complex 1 subunit 6 isoform X1 [Eumetopias jubatus]